jgi:hypothetical protein
LRESAIAFFSDADISAAVLGEHAKALTTEPAAKQPKTEKTRSLAPTAERTKGQRMTAKL